MTTPVLDPPRSIRPRAGDLRGLCRLGGVAALLLIVYCFTTIAQFAIVGVGRPPTAAGVFDMLHDHRFEALLRLDLPAMLALPLYYPLFLGLWVALKETDRARTLLAACLAFVGTTLVLATPTALSLIPLSDEYAAARSDAARSQLLSAGEAILATDMWHGTGAILGAILLQTGAVLLCFAMLRSSVFGKATAVLGIVLHSLDLAHIVGGIFVPVSGTILMAVAGPLYPIWFFLIARKLLRLSAGRV